MCALARTPAEIRFCHVFPRTCRCFPPSPKRTRWAFGSRHWANCGSAGARAGAAGAHEPFTGLHLRLAALETGIQRKLAKLRGALAAPRRVVDVLPVLFSGPMSPAHPSRYCLATGEALAYLNDLLSLGASTWKTMLAGGM